VCGIEKKVVDFCVLYHSDANHQILLKKTIWFESSCSVCIGLCVFYYSIHT